MTGTRGWIHLVDWHGELPYGATALGLTPARLAEAEEKAAAALAGLVLPASWLDVDPAERRRLVAACRIIPTEGLWHVTDDRPDTDEDRARQDCLRVLADDWPYARLMTAEETDRLPGLTALARLSAVVCRLPVDGEWLDAEEDLLDIYDTFSVGGMPELS
ncbi:hypothetical protein ACGFRB_26305 [Streptomyces sp. NPDC048718]|uniref:hypothetical protein n=1 Tax=Streptomyces sp. NPDC048718 TaxID=3365587 RepID=UPI003714EFD8